jgi:hypothetical protein
MAERRKGGKDENDAGRSRFETYGGMLWGGLASVAESLASPALFTGFAC